MRNSRLIWTTVLATTLSLLAGCGGGSLSLRSVHGSRSLQVRHTTKVFSAPDASSADFFLTDLPPELWRADADLSGASGTLVHLHLYIPPVAGKTPIAESASNLNIRCIVISRGEVGVYAGGGFLYTSGSPADRKAGGTIHRASMKLTGHTPAFEDLLEATELDGSFECAKEEGTAKVLAARMTQLLELSRQ